MRKNILAILTFLFLFILSGCGSTSKTGDSGSESTVAVEMQNNYIVQDDSGINFTLAIPFTKKLDSSYLVELSEYGLTVGGCNINSIEYTPVTLTLDGAYDSVETLYVTGTFDQDCTVTAGYTFTATQTVTKDSDIDIRPFSATFDYDNRVDVNGYAFNNLISELDVTSYEKHKIEFQLAQDGVAVPAAQVVMKVMDQRLGSVEAYFVTTDENGKGDFIYIPPAVFPDTGTLYIAYTDGNITLEAPITLDFNLDAGASDGRATTLSIVYESTTSEPGKMIGHYHVHAVDRDSRLPIVGIPIKMSLVNGIREIGNTKLQTETGNIQSSTPASFSDDGVNFAQTDVEAQDNLIIFPSEGKIDPVYLGGWKVEEVGTNLTLAESYLNLESTEDLTYIIGNERRLLGRDIAVADVQAINAESTTDENGFAYFDITFDPILAGHTVSLEAHGDDNGNRIGISKIATLRWDDFSGSEETFLNIGEIVYIPMTLSIEPENGGSEYLIDVDIVPSSFEVKTSPHCTLLGEPESNFHTDGGGQVILAIATDANTTATGGVDECSVTWKGEASSIYYEY